MSWRHPNNFQVSCCSGRRLILGGVLVCTVCDGPVLGQSEKGQNILRVPPGINTVTPKPPIT